MTKYLNRKKIFIFCMYVLVLPLGLFAQNNTSSPLSMFGLGEIESREIGRMTGMGNVGIGVHSANFLNRKNPAGLSAIDTLAFILDVSATVKMSQFRTQSEKDRTNDFNFKNISVGFRITKMWTTSVGLTPYSNVGYRMRGGQTIEGADLSVLPQDVYYSGSGGINKFYWANAVELFRGFSLGATASYYFGTMTNSEETSFFSISRSKSSDKIHFDFGMQYTHNFGDFTRATIGGVYSYKTENRLSQLREVADVGAGTIVDSQPWPDTKIYMPETYGAGLSVLTFKGKKEWLFAADYQYTNWSVNKIKHKTLRYTDSHVYSLGIQMTPNVKRSENYFQLIRFQVGATYNQSYLTINGYQLEDYSISAGLGLPFRNLSYVNIAVNVGQSGTGKRGGITERYVLFSVNLSLIERWFAKELYK